MCEKCWAVYADLFAQPLVGSSHLPENVAFLGSEYLAYLVIHFTLVMNQAILGLALLAAKTESVERRFSKTSGGIH